MRFDFSEISRIRTAPGKDSKGKPRFPWPLERGQGENHSEGFPLYVFSPIFFVQRKWGRRRHPGKRSTRRADASRPTGICVFAGVHPKIGRPKRGTSRPIPPIGGKCRRRRQRGEGSPSPTVYLSVTASPCHLPCQGEARTGTLPSEVQPTACRCLAPYRGDTILPGYIRKPEDRSVFCYWKMTSTPLSMMGLTSSTALSPSEQVMLVTSTTVCSIPTCPSTRHFLPPSCT